MRWLAGLICMFFLAVPAAAQADVLCDFASGGDYAYQQRLWPFLGKYVRFPETVPRGGEGDDAARSVLGAQFTGIWADTPRQGWSVAFAPGPQDASTARAGIHDYLAARLSPDDVAYLDSTLNLFPVPYSEAELNAVRDAILEVAKANPGLISGIGNECNTSDAFRVGVGIIDAETPELRARVEQLLAPFGDKVRARYGVGYVTPDIGPAPSPPGPLQTAAKLRVGDYASLPRSSRCVRGERLGVKASNATVTLSVGARRAIAKPGKRAALRLTQRRTKVTVTVRLPDGRTAAQTLMYRRC